MSVDLAYLREQASRCRRLAKSVLDAESAQRLNELAAHYEREADELARPPGPVMAPIVKA